MLSFVEAFIGFFSRINIWCEEIENPLHFVLLEAIWVFVNSFFSPLIFHDFLLLFGYLSQIVSPRKSRSSVGASTSDRTLSEK